MAWRLIITRVLKVFGWLLVVAAAFVLVGGVYSAFWISEASADRLAKTLSLTASALVPAGLLLTLGGLFLTKSKEAADAEERRSLFYLESCTEAYEAARSLLADENNDRAT